MWIPDRVKYLFVVMVLFMTAVGTCSASDPFTLRAVMIWASDEPAPLDARLEKVEFRLRRIFKFEHYHHYGEATAILNNASETTLSLGRGHRLEITTSPGKNKRVRTQIRWVKGDTTQVNTAVYLKRNVPTILGGPPHEGGNLIVTLTVE